MPNPPKIDADIVAGLTTIEDFINLIIAEFEIPADDVSLTSIDIFTLEEATYTQEGQNFAFTLAVTIAIDQDEEGEATKELSGSLLIEMKTTNGTTYTGKYGGSLEIPIKDQADLVFDLAYQTKTEASKVTKLVVGSLNVDANPDVGNVALSDLFSEICPPLAPLFPEELLDTFHLGSDVIFVINSTNKTATVNQKKMLFSIGFNAEIAFSDIPLIGELLPPDLLQSEFAFEFLVSFQRFEQKEIKTINSLLEELNAKLLIKPPCSNINYLERGANLGAHFKISLFTQAWLLPLVKTPSTGTGGNTGGNTGGSTGGSRSLTTTTNNNNNTGSVRSDDVITLADNGVWLNIQKSFGPLYFDKVGLVYKKGEIRLTPKFIIEVSHFVLILNGLYISTPLVDFDPDFNLDGFGLEWTTRSMEIGGAFLTVEGEDGDKNYNEYLGTATIGFKKKVGPALALSAIGAFADYDGRGFALFLYLAADYPFGGPPFFFVIGLSGGFGYNYDLILPPIEEVAEFPLVAQAMAGPRKIDPKETEAIITEELESLQEYIIPAIGSGFGSIGLKFTCFKIIDGFGLLTLGMSQGEFEISFLGIATIMLPTTLGRHEPIAMAELAIAARFNPMEGVILVQGQLTENSYIFSRKCRLTGGFAYGLWFLPPRIGDFVFTQGGYHPRFKCADRYPTVPRLGFDWQIDSNSHTVAQVYFALCGHGIMAGGLMDIRYQLGSVWAQFEAGVDLLFGWAPYHYDVDIHCFVRAGIGALSVGLGMGIHFWGPDFGCKFKILIIIIKVTIKIGDQSSIYPFPINWDEFEATFLPEPKDVCSLTSIDGLVKQILEEQDGVETEIWIINPTVFEMSTDSLVPTKQAFVGGNEKTIGTNTNFAINSMGVTIDELETSHKVTIVKDLAGDTEEAAEDKFKFEPILKLAPTSTWGQPTVMNGHIKPPEVNGEQFVEDVFFGFRILPADPPYAGKTHEIGVEHLQYETEAVPDAYLWESVQPFIPDSNLDEPAKRDRIQTTIADNAQRNSILEALGCDVSQVDMDDAEAIANSFTFAPFVK
ncbi:MAG: DUF6603 domain-containing protein [Microcoleaceae cyanobacterium]